MERKRSDIIADELESLILDGSFSDGARLDESQLAERFKVSRTPLREAFQRLALSGLAEQIPRRGVFVRQPGPVELIEMFEVMAALEALCGELAAARITDAALDAVRGSELWIVDALRWTPHPTHAHVDRALEWIERTGVPNALLTNLHLDLDYQSLKSHLPAHVDVAHDGWTARFSL